MVDLRLLVTGGEPALNGVAKASATLFGQRCNQILNRILRGRTAGCFIIMPVALIHQTLQLFRPPGKRLGTFQTAMSHIRQLTEPVPQCPDGTLKFNPRRLTGVVLRYMNFHGHTTWYGRYINITSGVSAHMIFGFKFPEDCLGKFSIVRLRALGVYNNRTRSISRHDLPLLCPVT